MEACNSLSTTKASMPKRHVVFVKEGKPLPGTMKGTIKRSAAEDLYVEEIRAVYEESIGIPYGQQHTAIIHRDGKPQRHPRQYSGRAAGSSPPPTPTSADRALRSRHSPRGEDRSSRIEIIPPLTKGSVSSTYLYVKMEGGTDVFSVEKARLTVFEAAINEDHEYKASSAGVVCCFAVRCADTEDGLVITVDHDNKKPEHAYTRVESTQQSRSSSSSSESEFILYAQADHWRQFFSAIPKRPFQSYWGMLRLLGTEANVKVDGDLTAFTTHAHLWRLILDKIRYGMHPPRKEGIALTDYAPDDERDDDSIRGHYTWLGLSSSMPIGKCKIFYEVSGRGEQQVLFLHTAGADSRQFHSMMMSKDLQQSCTMYAFDLPGHGRSFPGTEQYPLSYANSEDFYIAVIGQFIAKLDLKNVIVSGASMGGQVCLAVALRAKELYVGGVIPCEACDYLPKQQAQSIYGLAGDESVLNPERVCGMISPTSPEVYKRLNWWIYSSQAARIFPGDLKFYFEGWDGRDRMKKIDTQVCPVYMLTGEYDYSCSVDASRATAAKIKGAVFEEMNGLGHFPFSEDPEMFLPYFKRALEHIWQARR